jgi:putative hemolysin
MCRLTLTVGREHSRGNIITEDMIRSLARDLLKLGLTAAGGPELSLRSLLRPAYFVPESKPAAEQFEAFRQRKRSFALTVDEYGGVTGVVTMEDLLECIFGDIPSPSDVPDEDLMTPVEGGKWSVDGMIPVEDFARALDTHFDDVVLETVGGLVLHELGELPAEGTAIDIGEFRFTVVAVENNRISRVIVEPKTRLPRTEAGLDSEAGTAPEPASEHSSETKPQESEEC